MGLTSTPKQSTLVVMQPQSRSTLLPAERHERIRRAVRDGRVVSTEKLAEHCRASPETIRRDLIALEKAGLIARVHGGAASTRTVGEPEYAERSTSASAAKAAIGRSAAGLIESAATVFFDVGTTVLAAARALPTSFRGTVATCSLVIATELAGRRGVELLVSGGRLRAGDLALANARTVEFFADLHADVALLGSGGVEPSAGLTDFHLDEVATRRMMLAHASRSYVLADSSKLNRIAPHRVCGLDAITAIVTDEADATFVGDVAGCCEIVVAR